jgi:hypothetical protein
MEKINMLASGIKERAKTEIEKMKISGEQEAIIPDSPLTVVKRGSEKQGDFPISAIEGYLIVQRGL